MPADFNPLIITCAISGAELSKKDTPHLPVTPEELAESAFLAVKAGAGIIHLHVRDEAGNPTQRVEIFEEVTQKIKKKCDCIIQYSTGGAVGTSLNERIAPLKLKPEMATLSMGSINFGSAIFENSEPTIVGIAEKIVEYGIFPELEIFDSGMLNSVERLLKAEKIPARFHLNFVLGVPGGIGGSIKELLFMTEKFSGNTWSVAGIGRFQLPLSLHAIAMGGHVRVGMEDNIYYKKGELAKSNSCFVERVVRIAKEMNRPVATVSEIREIFGLI